MTWATLFLILAALFFLLDALMTPVTPKLNKFSLAWFFVVVAWIVGARLLPIIH